MLEDALGDFPTFQLSATFISIATNEQELRTLNKLIIDRIRELQRRNASKFRI